MKIKIAEMQKKVMFEILQFKHERYIFPRDVVSFIVLANAWKFGARANWRNNCTRIMRNIAK